MVGDAVPIFVNFLQKSGVFGGTFPDDKKAGLDTPRPQNFEQFRRVPPMWSVIESQGHRPDGIGALHDRPGG
jgi:hypothetical protein